MTDHTNTAADDRIVARGLAAAVQMRERLAAIEAARDAQPERLAAARAAADAAREECLSDPSEHWLTQVRSIPTYSGTGEPTGGRLDLPTMTAKGVFGTRLAFDLLAHAGDAEAVDAAMVRYFAMARDKGQMFLLCAEALKTIAVDIAPNLLRIIEDQGGDWTTRVALAETARVAWATRLADLPDAGDAEGEQ